MNELLIGIIVLGLLLIAFLIGQMSVKPPVTSWGRVLEFHETFGHPAPEQLTLLDDGRQQLRVDLIQEELDEYKEALAAGDIVAVADALGDLDYVVNGAAIEHGIVLPVITAEIHRSNMTKLGPDGKPIYREDGKILKGEGYEPPKLAPLLGK